MMVATCEAQGIYNKAKLHHDDVKNRCEIKPMTGFWSKVKEVGCWLGDMVMDGSAKNTCKCENY